MANEYTPELNDAVYQAILRKLKEEQEQQLAQASGEAMRRGISGSNYEARRQGDANRAYQTSSADALVSLNVENAGRLREERLRKEEQEFTAGRDTAQRQWQELENNKQRAFERGNLELAQQFEMQQRDIDRAWQEKQASRQQRADLISTGLGSVANVGSQLLGMKMASGLFGSGASASTGSASPIGSSLSLFGSGPGSTLTGAPAASGGLGAAGALGIGALGVGAQIGQSLFAQKNLGVSNKAANMLSFIPGGATQYGIAKKGLSAVKKIGKKLF